MPFTKIFFEVCIMTVNYTRLFPGVLLWKSLACVLMLAEQRDQGRHVLRAVNCPKVWGESSRGRNVQAGGETSRGRNDEGAKCPVTCFTSFSRSTVLLIITVVIVITVY